MLIDVYRSGSADVDLKVHAAISPGSSRWILAAGVSFLTSLVVIAPFFWLGNVYGHDFGFHLSSWLDVAAQWKEGIAYPRWAEWANFGFGEPRFIFYPPLSWMLGAALSFLAPWKAVPCAFIALVETLAGLGAYRLARRFLPEKAALLAVALYATNPYALLDIYLRSAFGELLACAFLPLVILSALELSGLVGNARRSLSQTTGFFAAMFAAVWLSDVPAAILASYSVALLFLWAAVEEKALRPLWNGAGGLALGFGLAGFYLLPAIYEQRWINIARAVSKKFRLLPSENFLYTQLFDLEHTAFSWLVSTVAILVLAMTGIAAVLWHRRIRRREENCDGGKVWRVLLLLSSAAAFLMFRPSLVFWKLLPKLQFIQFPWRWMAVLAIAYAFFLAAAMAPRRKAWAWGAAVLAILAGTTVFIVQNGKSQNRWGRHEIAEQQGRIAKDEGLGSAGEYTTLDRDYWNVPEDARQTLLDVYYDFATEAVPRVIGAPARDLYGPMPLPDLSIHRWTAEEKDIFVSSAWPVLVALRLSNYPAWRVEVNGKRLRPFRCDFITSNMMTVWAPAGASEIRVRFARTPDRPLGAVLSAASVMILAALYWRGRRPAETELTLEPATPIEQATAKDSRKS